MKRSQREELLDLIIFCDKCNYSVQEYGWSNTEAIRVATVIDCEYGHTYKLEYRGVNGWREVPDMIDNETSCEICPTE